MGDIAEYYMDLAMEQDAQWQAERYFIAEAVKNMEKKYMMGVLSWTTIEGEKILVQNLSDKHLENCIAFQKRKDKEEVGDKWLELLGYELKKRNATKALLNKGK
jgi:hypothetical protein